MLPLKNFLQCAEGTSHLHVFLIHLEKKKKKIPKEIDLD